MGHSTEDFVRRLVWLVPFMFVLGLWALLHPKSYIQAGRKTPGRQSSPEEDRAETQSAAAFYLMVSVALFIAYGIYTYVR